MTEWNQSRIQQYIDEQIQENLTLEYKRAGALGRQNNEVNEITKDVSAMANSAGGLIIYGVSEYQQPDKKHLPEKIYPIDRTQFSREWLEQIIGTIRPRIDGVIIHPVDIDTAPNHVVYVVEIPQSTTAHQARDHVYYKRFNFKAEPMEDYEVRDVMARSIHPKIELSFEIEIEAGYRAPDRLLFTFSVDASGKQREHQKEPYRVVTLLISAKNIGYVMAQYVNVFIQLPHGMLPAYRLGESKENSVSHMDMTETTIISEDNTVRDVTGERPGGFYPRPTYGPARYVPILPNLRRIWRRALHSDFEPSQHGEIMIAWKAYSDNAPANQGNVLLKDIPVVTVEGRERQ